MCIFAHPDDETLGTGGILAKYADEGVQTYLVTATRGERGWFGDPDDNPGLETLGQIRTKELLAAANILGLQEVNFLDYIDGDLDQADHDEVVNKLVSHIRRIRPDVILTFDPNGAYGHPDHIAICQFTTAATVRAADSDVADTQNQLPHTVAKLYYMVETQQNLATYEEAFGTLMMNIDGVERRAVGWQEWAITTRINTTDYWQQVWQAIACHQTQLPSIHELLKLPESRQKRLFSTMSLYRAFSLVNGGREPEDDLFAGLRKSEPIPHPSTSKMNLDPMP
jgi:LmbE family N-acetylglucosaminyl deacetylase